MLKSTMLLFAERGKGLKSDGGKKLAPALKKTPIGKKKTT